MADNVTNELILEHLKRMHEELGNINARLDSVDHKLSSHGEMMLSLAHSFSSMTYGLAGSDSKMNELRKRIERIERRLDLTGP